MRTKTKILSVLLGALTLGSASLMAQSTNVYSLNAVGYINVTCPPGFSMIADQLFAANGNAISNILNNTAGAYNDASIYKWTGTSYALDNGDGFDGSGNGSYWAAGGTNTMNPGEALWFQNGDATNIVITFVGTVPQGTLTNTIFVSAGYNMVSSIVPQGGDLCTNLGLTNVQPSDTVYVYSNVGGVGSYAIYQVDPFGPGSGTSTTYMGEWDSATDPMVAVGQGFWYQVASGTPAPWVRTFSVNQ